MKLRYFAYGSNLHLRRLAERIGEFGVHAVAALHGFQLAFHKRGQDQSGKCNIHFTGDPQHVVHGAVYEIHPEQKLVLDRIEGVGRGYEHLPVQLAGPYGLIDAFAYRAQHGHIDPLLLPYEWYKLYVLEGARQHRLPAHYISYLEKVEHLEDPDRERDRNERRMLLPES
jgi:hypothetical protein